MRLKIALYILIIASAGVVLGEKAWASDKSLGKSDVYINPYPVQIVGFSGSEMEPFISLDGKFLFFNDDENPRTHGKTIYYATRTGLTTFQYIGELPGVNTHASNKLEAVPSVDLLGRFYFTSTRQFDKDGHSIFVGRFDGREVTDVHVVGGDISPAPNSGWINMDASISPDGDTLFISRTHFELLSLIIGAPSESHILVAHRHDNDFVLDKDGAAILRNVNTGLEYAPDISADSLEIYFNRGPHILVASRNRTDQPFGVPCVIEAIDGFVEGASISLDKSEMFFHKKVGDSYAIFRAERNPNWSSVACDASPAAP